MSLVCHNTKWHKLTYSFFVHINYMQNAQNHTNRVPKNVNHQIYVNKIIIIMTCYLFFAKYIFISLAFSFILS
jgi:hypothetical protein